ncbi:uracil-DNA glycosylase family protein [Celeribacter halophilus]|uniref:uracil-DNA glycosylase family protein n=1 Tax=Celeribacter halophilus TaxID=576117 RepID=UPI002FD5BB2D
MRAQIEAAYEKSGNTMGWRLLASPECTLHVAKVAFIGLNPGGSAVDAAHSVFSMPDGRSAYVDESWAGFAAGESPLQRQVRALFDRLKIAPEVVLAGNLVPFRSPDWASLVDPKGSLAFGKELWRGILRQAGASIVITMGGETTKAVADLLHVQNISRYPVGWGKITAQRGSFQNGTLIGLPHLSRFGVMNRAASSDHLDRLFDDLTN